MRPNILIVMSDDHSAQAIGAYHPPLANAVHTPHIDALAREGARCDRCYCTNALCTPSRATILTGLYSHECGVKTLDDPLPVGLNTFPRALHDAGYQTALVGKWHLHTEPQGFDYFDVLAEQGIYFDPYFLTNGDLFTRETMYDRYRGARVKGYVTDIITDKCVDFLRKRDRSRPFLLLCHHKAPHDNFEYAKRHEHALDGAFLPPPGTLFEDRGHRSLSSRDFGGSISRRPFGRSLMEEMTKPDYPTGALDVTGLSPREKTLKAYDKYLRDYLRTVMGIDESVGRLTQELKAQGCEDDTLIIYTSDQGMFLGEHDYFDKRWMFEESMRMPLIARYPREIPGGTVTGELIRNLDIAKTVCDYASVPFGGSGVSVRAALAGGESGIQEVYYRYWMHMAHLRVPAHYGLVTRERKLIFYYGRALDATGAIGENTPPGWEYYDLKRDPNETRNRYRDPAYAREIADMKARLRAVKEQIGDDDARYPQIAECLRDAEENNGN